MSNAFAEREKGFERKYQLDQDQAFKVQSRRDKYFGLWIAAKLGKTGGDAEAYAKEVVIKNMDLPGDEDMLGKVRDDLKAINIAVEENELPAQLRKAEADAAREILGPQKN